MPTITINNGALEEKILDGNATLNNVLQGKTFYTTDPKVKLTGTMTNNEAVFESVAANDSYTIPEGYHNGFGIITGPVLEGNAANTEVLNGKTFYANNGTIQAGTMRNRGAILTSVKANDSYTIPEGYHNGNGAVSGPSLTGNAVAADVRSGKTFYSNSDEQLTGTLACGNVLQSSCWYNYGGSGYGAVVDTGDTINTKAVFVAGTRSGTGNVGGGQGSNDGSSWTGISSGFHTYRYYRAWASCTDSSSSISYGYIGVINLGYVR